MSPLITMYGSCRTYQQVCSYVRQDPYIVVTCLIHRCDRTRFYTWHDLFIYMTWLLTMMHALLQYWTRCWSVERVIQIFNALFKYWTRYSNIERVIRILNALFKYWTRYSNVERVIQILNALFKYWTRYSNIERVIRILNALFKCWIRYWSAGEYCHGCYRVAGL